MISRKEGNTGRSIYILRLFHVCTPENEAVSQIINLLNQDWFREDKIRIMPTRMPAQVAR